MSVRSAESVTTVFTTSSFSTGALVNADSLPTGVLYLNGTANGATVTVTNITTGIYKAAVTLPTLAVNDLVSIVISATVGGVAGGGKVWEDAKDVFAGAIPDAAANAAGGLLITAAGSLDMDEMNVDIEAIQTGVAAIPTNPLLASAMTESYAAKGAQPTPIQALYAILQKLFEVAVVGTTETINKLDGTTPAMTETLNDGTNPTSVTRAT